MNNEDENFDFPDLDNEESPCEHCKLKNDRLQDLMKTFISISENGRVDLQEVLDLFADFYDEAYEDGEQQAYENIGFFALDLAHGNHEDGE